MSTWLLQFAGRLRAFFRQGSFDRDFDQELESHLDMLAEEHCRRGMTPEQARRAARIELGGIAQLREAHREVRGIPWLSAFLQDLQYALRTLRNTPGFTATALAALALGIGATTAVFSLVNAVLLKPIPVPDPDRFVQLVTTSVSDTGQTASYPGAWAAKFALWRAQTSVLQDVSAYLPGVMNYAGGEIVEQLQSMQISADAFHCWGTPILQGRGFTREEDSPGGPEVAVISEDFWQRGFARDARVLGKTVSLNGILYTVIGVAANSPVLMEEGAHPDMYVPFQLDPNSIDSTRRFRVMARLRPGVGVEQADARLQIAAGEYRARFPNEMGPKDGFSAVPYRDYAAGGNRPLLMVLLGAVGLVLLIACANVANLLLARAEGRRREIAIRAAIGAGRGRMVRQLLTESLLLSLAGGALGLLLGYGGIRALLAVNTAGLPRLGVDGNSVGLDWRVLAFTLALSLATGILFGLFPALEGSRADLKSVLKDSSGRSGTGIKHNRARAALVVSEVGLAVILLVGSALLMRTFVALYSVNPGFDSRNVITMRMKMTGSQYQASAGVANAMRDGLEQIRALPGVAFASATYFIPLQMAMGSSFNIVGRPTAGNGGWAPVATGYFEVFRIPVKRGRTFNDRDDGTSPPVAVINESMARQYWKDGDPLKDRIVIGRGVPRFLGEPERQIIGVVGDIRDGTLYREPRPTMYVPQAQITDAMNAFLVRIQPLGWIVRTQADPHALVPAIREQLRQATGLPVSDVYSMDGLLSLSTSKERFNMLLMTVFGSAALLLAAIGIYGLMAYSVEQRTREIGIRLALGAGASQVRNRIVRQGLGLALAGVVVGIGAAWALSRLIESLLFGVKARDPLVFVAVPAVLSVVALLAAWLPASRASRIAPWRLCDMNSIRVLFLAAALAAGQPAPPDPIFRSGTRLVEVNVVVRDQQVRPPGVGAWFKWVFDSGPPFGPPGAPVKGLTKDDFTLLDQGRPQPIAVFSAGPSSGGQPPKDATVVLIDLLNTPWVLTDYACLGMKNFLRALTGTDGRIAVYSLGKSLHILHDFTDDPLKLMEAAARLPPEFATALRDYGDPPTAPPSAPGAHAQITIKAVTRIVQHLSGVPGHKNMVWLSQMPRLPPTVMALMQQANIVLYPVRVRSGSLAALGDESTTRDLATAAGGRAFHDAMDLTFAVQAAVEDSSSGYVLGFYPAPDLLDGTYHKITVRIDRKAPEIYYRSGYLATKVAVPVPSPSLAELVEDPLESFRLGFAAEATPEAQRPGLYDLRVTVDLHDIHLDHKESRFTGGFDVSVPNPSDKGTVMTAKFAVSLTEEQLAEALRNGFTVIVSGAESDLGEIRVVVRDRSTGIAGSLRVPAAK